MKNLRLRRYLSSDYFRRKETRKAKKSQPKSFTFYPVIVTLKSRSQMLFRKVQKGQQNVLSTSLKVKKVTSRLSDLVLRRLKGFIY